MNTEFKAKGKPDDEKQKMAIAGGIFTAVLFIVDILFAAPLLATGWIIPFAILHVALIAVWGVVVVNFKDPNYDKWRVAAVILAVLGLCLVLGHMAYRNEDGAVMNDSNQAKQEEVK